MRPLINCSYSAEDLQAIAFIGMAATESAYKRRLLAQYVSENNEKPNRMCGFLARDRLEALQNAWEESLSKNSIALVRALVGSCSDMSLDDVAPQPKQTRFVNQFCWPNVERDDVIECRGATTFGTFVLDDASVNPSTNRTSAIIEHIVNPLGLESPVQCIT